MERITEFFGEVSRVYGMDFLIRCCKEILRDNGANGLVYSFLARFPFQAYFTTNFDDALKRHLTQAGVFCSVFLNRKQDFQDLDKGGGTTGEIQN